jgi:hypothetical protein
LATVQQNRKISYDGGPILIAVIADRIVTEKSVLNNDTRSDGTNTGLNEKQTRGYLSGFQGRSKRQGISGDIEDEVVVCNLGSSEELRMRNTASMVAYPCRNYHCGKSNQV